MRNRFNKPHNPRISYEQKYNSSRINLLVVTVFTFINLVLLVSNSDLYFLFSAFVPYIIGTYAMILCGKFPAEYYTDGLEDVAIFDNTVFVILLAIAIIITILYLIAWIFSSKHRVGWLIFALVFFVIDTIGMFYFYGIALDSIIDILFHVWVIYYLCVGIYAHFKLKSLPDEEEDEYLVANGEQ